MCTVSYVADDWNQRHPFPYLPAQWPPSMPPSNDDLETFRVIMQNSEITRAEFDALKAELESFKKLLIAAKIYDEEIGQPGCESADKVALFKTLAKLLNVDLSDVFE